ncbi:hypothetical protein ACFQ8C_16680 [Streptomyces sp. NPDC056503]|uniref:hypothetical protein n=1 Tax=Streptomyces sp. NPDC056503 TaxID=3345842 RepID=UPI003687D7AA
MNDHATRPAAPAPASTPSSADAFPPGQEARALRRGALWAGLLFLPATLLVVLAALSSETGSECVMRGTCGDVPGWLYAVTLAVAGTAWLAALTTPDGHPPATARWAALWTLIAAEVVFLGLVMGHFSG